MEDVGHPRVLLLCMFAIVKCCVQDLLASRGENTECKKDPP